MKLKLTKQELILNIQSGIEKANEAIELAESAKATLEVVLDLLTYAPTSRPTCKRSTAR